MSQLEPDQRDTQLVVLGAGPGGYAAAFRAADLGMKVTLVDPEANPGGVCLYHGCIPSKALLHVAALLEEARAASAYGIDFAKPRIDPAGLSAWKDGVVEQLTAGLGGLCKSRKIDYVRGRGVFYDANTIELQSQDTHWQRLRFESCIIATGSRPVLPSELASESPLVMTSTGALELNEVPPTLLVVGGGYIGLELATVYAALDSRVTVVEMTESLLPGVDRDLVRPLAKSLDRRLDEIQLDTSVSELSVKNAKVSVVLESGGSKGPQRSFDRALVAVGRRPNSSGLGLANTKVEIDGRGFIRTDVERRTAEPNVFAIGDVAGDPMLAHKATHEGLVAAEAAAGRRRGFEPAAIPAVVFTDPEIAWCGLTETEAKEQGREVQVGRFPWAASGRALTLGRSDGVTKIIAETGSGRMLGAGIVGPRAGELIAEAVVAIEGGLSAEDLALSIHPHPSLSETLMEAAEGVYGLGVHVHKRRR